MNILIVAQNVQIRARRKRKSARVVVVVVVGGELFVFVLLLQGLLPFLQDGGDLPLHERPGHVGAGKRTTVSTGAEYLGVAALLLDGIRRAGETEFVMANSRTLNKVSVL